MNDKIISLSGAPIRDPNEPEHRDYTFHTKSGKTVTGNGYLVVTGAFHAVGRGKGDILLSVPNENLDFVVVNEPVKLDA